MPNSPRIFVQEIQDPYIRKNFQALADYFDKQNQLLDFQFVEMDFSVAVSKQRVRHGLAVVPRDLLRLEVTGSGIVTFHRGLFDTTYMIVSASGPAHVRMLAGLYRNIGADVLAQDVTEQWKSSV